MTTPIPARSTSADPRAIRVRAQIRRAALELVEQCRVEEVGVSDVTSRAGVSRQVFYQHFRDRDDAIAAAVAAVLAEVVTIPERASSSPLERVHLLCDYAAAHSVLYRNLYSSAASQRIADAARAVLVPTCVELARDLLDARPGDAERTGRRVEGLAAFLASGITEVIRLRMQPAANDGTITAAQLRREIDLCLAALGVV